MKRVQGLKRVQGRGRKPAPPSVQVTAIRLLGKWTRLAQGHVSLSAGCTCGLGVSAVRVQDFEQDILDYLRDKHGAKVGEAGSVEALLRRELNQDNAAMLADLERSMDSFDQEHSGR